MKIEKVKKLVANIHDKTEYAIHMRNSKKPLNNGLVLIVSSFEVHRVIKFNRNAWLKPYIDMNTDLRKKKQKMKNLKNIFLIWWKMQVLEKPCKMWENIEILTLPKQKEKELFSSVIKLLRSLIILLSFSEKIY